jgi:hypothetical protein
MSVAFFRLLQWSTDNQGRGVALINGRNYSHEEVCRLRDELAEVAQIGKTSAPAPAEDARGKQQ